MRTAWRKRKNFVEPERFLQGALLYAEKQKLDFNTYDTQYQELQCNFLPLLKDGSVIGVISINGQGEYKFSQLIRDPTMPGAPRGCQ